MYNLHILKARKKILAIIVLMAALVAGAYFISHKSDSKTFKALGVEIPKERELLVKDGDGDGLKDWEEVLWSTDMTNPDSDGDGAKDGEEIKAGRNPLVKGPDDKLDVGTIEKKINTTTEEDLTETDKFSRMIFAAYINSKQTGLTPVKNEAFQDFLSRTIEENASTSVIFTPEDILTIDSENKEIIRQYGNEIGAVLTKKPRVPLEHELLIVDRAIKNDDESELAKLADNIWEYERILEDLKKIRVPGSGAAHHIDLLNHISKIITGIKGMEKIFSDPIKAMALTRDYPEAASGFVLTLTDFKAYFKEKGVVFKQGEDGDRFTRGI